MLCQQDKNWRFLPEVVPGNPIFKLQVAIPARSEEHQQKNAVFFLFSRTGFTQLLKNCLC